MSINSHRSLSACVCVCTGQMLSQPWWASHWEREPSALRIFWNTKKALQTSIKPEPSVLVFHTSESSARSASGCKRTNCTGNLANRILKWTPSELILDTSYYPPTRGCILSKEHIPSYTACASHSEWMHGCVYTLYERAELDSTVWNIFMRTIVTNEQHESS